MKIRGLRALVVGMKKSGVASVELLRCEWRGGARHRSQTARSDSRSARASISSPFAVQSDAVFEDCDLIVLSAGRAGRSAGDRSSAATPARW